MNSYFWKKWSFAGLFLFFALLPSLLQAHHVKGNIKDTDRQPVTGAYIMVVNTQFHDHSDENGDFAIQGVQPGDTLKISLLGYEPVRIVVEDIETFLDVTLEETTFDLGEVVVSQNNKELNVVSNIDVLLTPVQSSQEILRRVPGLFIGQHAGGGKAEQIFLRGFDIDHGTDVSITVDGMPVNMVSHAHGQGYADLHFLIPETIERIDFGKGPYYAEEGNFNTAGYVNFNTKTRIKQSQVSLEAGNFDYLRAVGMFKLLDTTNQHAYLATEFLLNNGPFESPQNFSRNNIMGRYTVRMNKGNMVSVIASHFTSRWDASGQIPQRAVDQGLITRFGAIDDTEGGKTSRTNLSLSLTNPLRGGAFLKTNLYYSRYAFELFSNFTFFLEDPENADQIRQQEERDIFGAKTTWVKPVSLGQGEAIFRAGGGFRSDRVMGVGLSRTANRRTLLENIQLGDVEENNFFAFASAELEFGNLLINPSVRYDYFKFNYIDDLLPTYQNQGQTRGIVSPKLNLIYDLSNNIQVFGKAGFGFHSNDTRVVLNEQERDILPAAFGLDFGALFKPLPRLVVNLALWHLYLEQEFVYVGDAGIVEPSGQTRRRGVDLSLRYQLTDWLYGNSDFTYSHARSLNDPEGENLIPLAPIVTATAGLSIQKDNYRANLQARYLGDRPANEDDSIVAEGYTIFDASFSYDFNRFTIGFSAENILDVDWNETQFATESRLRDEPNSVEEIHFTPGTPLFVKGILRFNF